MKILVKKDYDEMSSQAANIIKKEIDKNPNIVLGLATGSTPIGVYKELIRMHKEEGLDFSGVTTFNLDEYVGLDKNDSTSYNYFMKEHLFNHINIKPQNTFIPSYSEGSEIEYDNLIESMGGIDLQILGIGENGHIAFVEPSDKLKLQTGVVELTQDTIEVNSRFFPSIQEVPKTAISMGIGSIMKAKKIILLANGKNKAPIMKKIIEAKYITTEIPGSLLLLHQDATFIVTEEVYKK